MGLRRDYTPPEPAARLLRVEDRVRTYDRRFRLALAGYLILALGIVAAFYIFGREAVRSETFDERVGLGVGALCEAIRAAEEDEVSVIAERRLRLISDDCRELADRIEAETQ